LSGYLNRITKIFTVNNTAKILSLALAIFLFVFHNLNLLKTKVIASELQVEGSAGLIITRSIPENVSVRLRGADDDIAAISGADIITYIDLSGHAEKGEYRVPVQIIKSGVALNIDTLEITIEPVDIVIQLDKAVRKYVKVFPDIVGTTASGYDIISESLMPDQVMIEGPASQIENITSISTETFDISSRYNDLSVMLSLIKPPPLFTIKDNSAVKYSAVIREADIEKEFSDIPLTAVHLNEMFTATITPESGNVRLRGNHSLLENFVPASDLLTVDCFEITDEGSFTLPVVVHPPAPLAVSFHEPETVTVEIKIREQWEQ
jgi:YbbR domain-containing protein